MSYATVLQLRNYLSQVPTGAANDALLQESLDRACSIIDLELGFSFAAYGVAAAKDVYLDHDDQYLILPRYQAGSITAISRIYAKGTTSESVDAWTDWEELDDTRVYRYSGWDEGWYRVTAKWGYNTAPAALVEVELELAINLWLAKDSGQFSDVVGVEGAGAVGYQRAWTNRQREILQRIRYAHGEFGIA